MRILITLLLLLTVATVKADEIDYPSLPERVKSMDDFIPKGWALLDNSKGDLNKDGFDDYAFVLESKDSIRSYDFGDWSGVYNPRILGIAFWNESYGGYELKIQSNDFIITTKGDMTMDEPYEGLNIKNGTVWFDFRYWYSAGTWFMGTTTFVFRYQNGQFELIGRERTSLHRATHAYIKESINYSTRKAILFTQENEEDKGRTRNATFKLDKLYTFDTVGGAGEAIRDDIEYGV